MPLLVFVDVPTLQSILGLPGLLGFLGCDNAPERAKYAAVVVLEAVPGTVVVPDVDPGTAVVPGTVVDPEVVLGVGPGTEAVLEVDPGTVVAPVAGPGTVAADLATGAGAVLLGNSGPVTVTAGAGSIDYASSIGLVSEVAIPEPSTSLLAALAGLGLVARRRR